MVLLSSGLRCSKALSICWVMMRKLSRTCSFGRSRARFVGVGVSADCGGGSKAFFTALSDSARSSSHLIMSFGCFCSDNSTLVYCDENEDEDDIFEKGTNMIKT